MTMARRVRDLPTLPSHTTSPHLANAPNGQVTAHRTLGTRCRLSCNGTTPYLYSTSGYAPNGASYADSRVFAWGRVHVQNNTACRFESGYQAIGAANHAGAPFPCP